MARFSGKVALISGGARGQGAHEAAMLVAEGGRVVIGDILEEEGRALASALGTSARFSRLDVTREEDWASVIAAATDWEPPTLLINNAGIFRGASLEQSSIAEFEAHYRVNQLGPFLGMRALAPIMRAAGGGAIVNISSVAGLRGTAGTIAYGATKWALRGMTKIAASELASSNIRVNSVHPGLVVTDMIDWIPAAGRDDYRSRLPLGRLVTVAEVAEVVLFLLSDAAASMTGTEIVIDAGAVL